MNFFDHKDLGNRLLQLCPKVVKHPVYCTGRTTMRLRQFVGRCHGNKMKSLLSTTAPSYDRNKGYLNRCFSQCYCVDHRRGEKKRISELQGTAVYSNKLSRRCLNEVVFNVLNASKEGPYRSSSSSTSSSPYVSPFPELIKLSYFTFSEIVRRARPPNSLKFKGFLGKSQLQTEYRQLQRGISPQKLRNINYTYSQTTT